MSIEANPISEEDVKLLQLLKKEMKEGPKGENVSDLKEWMMSYLAASGDLTPKQEHEKSQHPKTVPIARYREPPKISVFSGTNNKGEASYDLWRYEVCSLLNDKLYDPDTVVYAVRRSLKGDAGMVAMHLGPSASVPDILRKLDSIYGGVENKEDLLGQFYRAKQSDGESVTKWSCRLEDLIGRAVEKGIVRPQDRNSMLHSMLWNGLRMELKDISGHKFDTIQDFDELRIALRQIERDHEERKTVKPHPSKAAAVPDPMVQQFDEVKGLIQQLTTRMDGLETRIDNRNDRGKDRYSRRQNSNDQQQYRQKGRGTNTQNRPSAQQEKEIPKCYRCGQPGHLRRGCVAILPKKDYLNRRKPMEQDHQ